MNKEQIKRAVRLANQDQKKVYQEQQKDWESRFDEKFVKNRIVQVDTSNSIELPEWKNPHSHLSREVKDFIKDLLQEQREEIIYWIKTYTNDLVPVTDNGKHNGALLRLLNYLEAQDLK